MKRLSIALVVSLALIVLMGAGLAKLPHKRAFKAIQAMVTDRVKGVGFEILEITPMVTGLVAVSVRPPYREFPNVILFKHAGEGNWQRVREGLVIGLHPKQGIFLDLHTTGDAADLLMGKRREYSLDEDTKKFIDSGVKTGLVVTMYRNFLHTHPAGAKTYFIDKTKFYDIGVQLFGDTYKKYKKDDCMIYDMVPLRQLELTRTQFSYVVKGITEDGQQWRVTFDGVSEDGYLLHKHFNVDKGGGTK